MVGIAARLGAVGGWLCLYRPVFLLLARCCGRWAVWFVPLSLCPIIRHGARLALWLRHAQQPPYLRCPVRLAVGRCSWARVCLGSLLVFSPLQKVSQNDY